MNTTPESIRVLSQRSVEPVDLPGTTLYEQLNLTKHTSRLLHKQPRLRWTRNKYSQRSTISSPPDMIGVHSSQNQATSSSTGGSLLQQRLQNDLSWSPIGRHSQNSTHIQGSRGTGLSMQPSSAHNRNWQHISWRLSGRETSTTKSPGKQSGCRGDETRVSLHSTQFQPDDITQPTTSEGDHHGQPEKENRPHHGNGSNYQAEIKAPVDTHSEDRKTRLLLSLPRNQYRSIHVDELLHIQDGILTTSLIP